jgi:hypothetical protein
VPIHLDSCIAGVFTPGNIGASSGLPPVEPAYISRTGDVIAETATATAVASAGLSFTGTLVGAATAADVVTVGVVVTATMVEAASATDIVSRGSIVADVVETAAADSVQSIAVAVTVAIVAGPSVLVSNATPGVADVGGVLVNQ